MPVVVANDRIGRIKRLTPTIGSEVLDVDLRELRPALSAQIRKDLLENLVIFFRDQELTREQHKAVARIFGPLHDHPVAATLPEHPEIVPVLSDENTIAPPVEIWHSDGCTDVEPPLGSVLYMKVVPPNGGGDTLFASTYAAYEALSPAMKRYLEGMKAVHNGDRVRGKRGIRDDDGWRASVEHPIVRTHPESGRKSLFVNRLYTSHVAGVSAEESAAILEYLYHHQENPRFQCRFKWRENSIAIWDNRCTLHFAVWDYFPSRRYAERLTICGDRPH